MYCRCRVPADERIFLLLCSFFVLLFVSSAGARDSASDRYVAVSVA